MAVTYDWERVVATTIPDFLRTEEVNVMRNYKLLALMQERGLISFGHSGRYIQWPVQYRLVPIQPFGTAAAGLTYSEQNVWQTAQLPNNRGYISLDAMSEMEREQNKGDTAIVKVWAGMVKRLMDSMKQKIGLEFYIDGEDAANSLRFHGINSFTGQSGPSSTGYVATPSDTYAGLNTNLADKGGSWSGNWPDGTGDPEYDYWAPLLVDYTDTAWTATTKTWPNTCLEALRYGIIQAQRNDSKDGQLDLIILDRTMYYQFLNALQAEERISVTRGQAIKNPSSSALVSLGFNNITNWDGVDVTWEFGVPNATGFGWCLGQTELRCLKDTLFSSMGPTFNPTNMDYRFSLHVIGNLRFTSPRGFLKFGAYT